MYSPVDLCRYSLAFVLLLLSFIGLTTCFMTNKTLIMTIMISGLCETTKR